ncbi:hypothetical protein QKU58_gp105 [Pyramimonas orientalis virus]|uniref:Uncharacterized protein n=1 Tax=Pyramimonas orientalis virus 01B TaxID=3134525 RepID=A0A7M3UNH1_9VIRU|nr:hypothetical protein QKU58_gp105 [Pyramimonas orientalis virus]QOI90226.1 hypothetical protein HWQ62_00089 [Pyramimonas orientalis virus]
MTDISSNDLLLLSLTNYYTKHKQIHVLKDIIESGSKVSLRLIDWYVTNYCKQNNVVYILKKKDGDEYFNVYMNYRSQLKAFKKILFDPFRRRARISFHYGEDEELSTTIGQLNFFRWAIDNDIIYHLENNICTVEKDMINRQKCLKNEKGTSGKSKELKNSIKSMTTFNVMQATVSFK